MNQTEPREIRKRHRDKGDLLFYGLLLALPLAQILVFYFGVNFQSILMAFQRYDAFSDTFIWDVQNNWSRFKLDVVTPGFWTMVKNSVWVYLFTTLSGTVLAVFFSYHIYRKRFGHTFFRFMLFLPCVIPGILLTVLYKNSVGLGLPAWLSYLFQVEVDNPFVTSSGGLRFVLITLFTIWISFGGQVLIYSATMDRVDAAIIEAGKIDGTTPWQEFWHLILPNIMPAVTVFIVTGLAGFFSNDNNVFNFLSWAAMPEEKTVGYFLYTLVYANGKTGYCYSAFLGMICSVILIPLVTVVRKLLDKGED